MSVDSIPTQDLLRQLEQTQARLREAEAILHAIHHNEIDAVVVKSSRGEQVYTLTGADHPYRALVESMNEGAATLTADGVILYCNRSFARLLDLPLEQTLGLSLIQLVAPGDAPLLADLIQQVKTGNIKAEITLLGSVGAPVPTQISLSALDLDDMQCICAIVTDLTEQKRSVDMLKAERLARAILEQATEAIVVCDRKGRVMRASRKAHELAGSPLYGRLFREAFTVRLASGEPLPWPPDVDGDGALAAAEFPTWRQEATLTCADGQTRYLLLSAALLYGDDHAALGSILTMTDITERRQAEEALREADQRKDQFLAMLAHELRNPLAPIRNAVYILRHKGSLDLELHWCRDVIDRQVAQMTRLLDDLLEVSRITQGKLELRKEWVDLNAIVQRALETSRPLLEAAGHQLTVAPPATPLLLEADPVRLAQVFSNLLNNAAKYTESGGHIWFTAERSDGEARVSVKDTGIGIPADQLLSIFEPFMQMDRSLGRSQGGLGIGLTLAQQLVRMHAGRIEAHSAGVGQGSEFVIWLPLANAAPATITADLDAGQVGAPRRRRVLVVDDNEDAATSLSMLLEVTGHETQTAYDGVEALAAAATFRPDVVLLDLGMPKLNGYEAARWLREQPWGKHMTLIAVTGWGQESDQRRTQEAGFDHHLVKPVDPAMLENLLRDLRDDVR